MPWTWPSITATSTYRVPEIKLVARAVFERNAAWCSFCVNTGDLKNPVRSAKVIISRGSYGFLRRMNTSDVLTQGVHSWYNQGRQKYNFICHGRDTSVRLVPWLLSRLFPTDIVNCQSFDRWTQTVHTCQKHHKILLFYPKKGSYQPHWRCAYFLQAGKRRSLFICLNGSHQKGQWIKRNPWKIP